MTEDGTQREDLKTPTPQPPPVRCAPRLRPRLRASRRRQAPPRLGVATDAHTAVSSSPPRPPRPAVAAAVPHTPPVILAIAR